MLRCPIKDGVGEVFATSKTGATATDLFAALISLEQQMAFWDIICALAVNTNPFLSTLPGDGNGQTLITLGNFPIQETRSCSIPIRTLCGAKLCRNPEQNFCRVFWWFHLIWTSSLESHSRSRSYTVPKAYNPVNFFPVLPYKHIG